MNRRQKIIVSVVGIFLVLLILVGLTYAYFLTKIQGNTKSTSITVKTANLALVYGDGNGIIEPTDPIVPGTTIASKTFTVTNNGDSTVNDYVVVLENVYNELVRPKDLVYTVECTSSDEKGCNGVSTETQFPIGKGSVGAGEGFGIVVTNSIDKDVVHTYTITLKYLNVDVDQSDDMNKTIQGKINIKDGKDINPYKSQEGTLANAIINNAINLTSEQKENGYAEFRATPLTQPGKETSTYKYETTGVEATSEGTTTVRAASQKLYWTYGTGYTVDENTGLFTLTGVGICQYNDGTCNETLVGKYMEYGRGISSSNTQATTTNLEKIYKITDAPASSTSNITVKYKTISNIAYSTESELSMANDELGVSYYYRGGVKNNYLTFNNMCWRIVRIEGDGAIKVVLVDATAGCSTATQIKTDSAYIGTGDYGYDSNNMADYENSQNRTSSMKYKLNIFLNGGSFSWYDLGSMTEATKTYTAWSDKAKSKLKTTNVCIGDTTNGYTSAGTLMTETEKQNAISANTTFYYNNYLRVYNNKVASFMCDTNKTTTSETQIYPLTVDEVMYAGGNTTDKNTTYYLGEYYYYWTISPSSNQTVFYVNYEGTLEYSQTVTTENVNLLPAVSLKTGTLITAGDGTITNPYIVE